METIILTLNPETRAKLDFLAKSLKVSSSFLVSEAVDIFVDAEIDKLRREAEEPSIEENFTYKPWKAKV